MPRSTTETIRYGFARTRNGRVLVATSDRGVCRVQLSGADAVASLKRWCRAHAPGAALVEDPRAVARAVQQIEEYARGERREFDLPLDLRGTPFQIRVWGELLGIPYGETRTYGDVARAIGAPEAMRAVGAANGRNPVPLVVPCHRVLAKDGLGGFTGGLHHKEALLALEGALLPG
jgi:O-6-methylguanine DNA methyltransferase